MQAVDVGLLLSAVVNRAEQTLSSSNQDTFLKRDKTSSRLKQQPTVPTRAISTSPTATSPATIAATAAAADDAAAAAANMTTALQHDNYFNNPTISTLALAHLLWSHVLRPDMGDTAIDATAGNGNDTVAIARMLFPSSVLVPQDMERSAGNSPSSDEGQEATVTTSNAQLLAVDIQELACQNTTEKLAALLPANILRDNVQVLHTSHAPLPLPGNTSSVALVVYNLGYLPRGVVDSTKGNEDRTTITTTETTIASLADAATVLRTGGMVSVMTYPRTNREEDFAVRAFLEGLALFSSVTVSWETHVWNDLECPVHLRERLAAALRRVLEEGPGGRKQKWRVYEHKKLGWIDAPILLTATRIN